MSDKFEEFLARLEMPFPEPEVVSIADQVGDIHEAYMGMTTALMRYTMQMSRRSAESILGKS
jgi:hypothetical protein